MTQGLKTLEGRIISVPARFRFEPANPFISTLSLQAVNDAERTRSVLTENARHVCVQLTARPGRSDCGAQSNWAWRSASWSAGNSSRSLAPGCSDRISDSPMRKPKIPFLCINATSSGL